MTREHAYKIREMMHKAAESLSDSDALDAIELYPQWASDVVYEQNKRIRYEEKLWRVLQSHTSQTQYPPSIYTAALYAEVEKPGQGDTPDNPIPYNNNMELIEGKYYSQFEVVYICTRSTGIPVYNNLADLVNIYVTVVE